MIVLATNVLMLLSVHPLRASASSSVDNWYLVSMKVTPAVVEMSDRLRTYGWYEGRVCSRIVLVLMILEERQHSRRLQSCDGILRCRCISRSRRREGSTSSIGSGRIGVNVRLGCNTRHQRRRRTQMWTQMNERQHAARNAPIVWVVMMVVHDRPGM